jgi:hypothetical protein
MALGYRLPADQALIAYGLTATLMIEGVSFLGFNEIIRSAFLIALGIPSAVSVTSIILNRFATFWFRLIISYGVFHLKILKPYSLKRWLPPAVAQNGEKPTCP